MNIAVLAKEVPDPEAPVTLDGSGRIVLPPTTSRLLSTYDENAIEAAVTIRETVEAHVTVITLGPASAEKVLFQAMAMGADDGVLIEEPDVPLSGTHVATILAAAIRRLSPMDLILCGRESADGFGGVVGPTIAEILGYPVITLVSKISVSDKHLLVERPVENGHLVMECSGPVLLTVGGEVNRPRYPAVMAMMKARRKGVQQWTLAELGIPEASLALDHRIKVVGYKLPPVGPPCQIINRETAAERAEGLLAKLREEQVI